MKRRIAALIMAGAAVGGSAIAEAGSNYPGDNDPVVTVSASQVVTGGTFNATVTDCIPGENVQWNFNGQTPTTQCLGASSSGFAFFQSVGGGTSTATFTAPTAPGTHSGTATLTQSGETLTFTINVVASVTTTTTPVTTATPSPNIPATGGSATTTITVAAVLLAAGAGLYFVSMARRRKTA